MIGQVLALGKFLRLGSIDSNIEKEIRELDQSIIIFKPKCFKKNDYTFKNFEKLIQKHTVTEIDRNRIVIHKNKALENEKLKEAPGFVSIFIDGVVGLTLHDFEGANAIYQSVANNTARAFKASIAATVGVAAIAGIKIAKSNFGNVYNALWIVPFALSSILAYFLRRRLSIATLLCTQMENAVKKSSQHGTIVAKGRDHFFTQPNNNSVIYQDKDSSTSLHIDYICSPSDQEILSINELLKKLEKNSTVPLQDILKLMYKDGAPISVATEELRDIAAYFEDISSVKWMKECTESFIELIKESKPFSHIAADEMCKKILPKNIHDALLTSLNKDGKVLIYTDIKTYLQQRKNGISATFLYTETVKATVKKYFASKFLQQVKLGKIPLSSTDDKHAFWVKLGYSKTECIKCIESSDG